MPSKKWRGSPITTYLHSTSFTSNLPHRLLAAMTRFRPCIDLHAGSVKQIVGGTLTDASDSLKTNHVSELPARHFAELYKKHDLTGAHVIMLGPGNQEAAREALAAWEGALQVGGGITDENARQWVEWGAEKVSRILDRVKACRKLLMGHAVDNYNFFPLPFRHILSPPPPLRSSRTGER